MASFDGNRSQKFIFSGRSKCPLDGKLKEVNADNIRLYLTVKINVGSLSLAEEVNDPNIWLRLMVINVGRLSKSGEVNADNIRLCLTVKLNDGSLSLAAEVNDCNIRLR